MAITATEARKRLFPLIKQVNRTGHRSRSSRTTVGPMLSRRTTMSPWRRPTICCAPRRTRPVSWPPPKMRRGRTLLTKTMDELQAMADEGQPR